MDVRPRGYASFDELADYCYHVASTVGLCCIHIWGYRSEAGKAERLAEACGIALQLTNILRDVREDARNGRIYLPEDELARFGGRPPRTRREPAQPARPGPAGLRGPPRLRLLRPGPRARAAGRPRRPARPADDHGDLPGVARRDRPARLQRLVGPRERSPPGGRPPSPCGRCPSGSSGRSIAKTPAPVK